MIHVVDDALQTALMVAYRRRAVLRRGFAHFPQAQYRMAAGRGQNEGGIAFTAKSPRSALLHDVRRVGCHHGSGQGAGDKLAGDGFGGKCSPQRRTDVTGKMSPHMDGNEQKGDGKNP